MKSSSIKHETQRAITTKCTYETSQICEDEKHAPGVCDTSYLLPVWMLLSTVNVLYHCWCTQSATRFNTALDLKHVWDYTMRPFRNAAKLLVKLKANGLHFPEKADAQTPPCNLEITKRSPLSLPFQTLLILK